MSDASKPARQRIQARVTAARLVTPHLRCLTLGGPGVAGFLQCDGVDAPAAWVKVFLPSGEGRAYTIRAIDREAGTLDIEFVLHTHNDSSGPLSAWASQARVGEEIAFGGPRDGGFRLPQDATWTLLAGDLTAMPALQRITEILPPGLKTHIVVEVEADTDRQVFSSVADIEATWLHERGRHGAALQQFLCSSTLPEGPGYVWLAGESGCIRALRGHYLQEAGVASERLSAKGYWKIGEAEHRDTR